MRMRRSMHIFMVLCKSEKNSTFGLKNWTKLNWFSPGLFFASQFPNIYARRNISGIKTKQKNKDNLSTWNGAKKLLLHKAEAERILGEKKDLNLTRTTQDFKSLSSRNYEKSFVRFIKKADRDIN